MNGFWSRCHLALAERRGWLLAAMLLLVLTAGGLVARLRFTEDFQAMLPLSDPAVAESLEALRHVRQADRLVVDVAVNRDDRQTLVQAADAMTVGLRSLPGLAEVRSGVDETRLAEASDVLLEQLPELLAAADLADLDSALTPKALGDRLAWFKRTLAQPQGLALQRVLRLDPAGFSTPVWNRLRQLEAGLGAGQLEHGHLISPDGRHVLLTAVPDFPPSNRRRSAQLLAAVRQAALEVEGRFAPGDIRVSITGAHRMALDNADLIRSDSARVTLLAAAGVVILLLTVFRRRWLALLTLVPTLLGALAGATALALTGDAVSAVALGGGACLIGITVDYAVHILYHTDNARLTSRVEFGNLLAKVTIPILAGALTTAAAFLVMRLSPMEGHRQLGLFAAVGVLAAAVVSTLVLPVFLPLNPNARPQPLALTTALDRVLRWRSRHGRFALGLLAGLSLLALWGVTRLRFETDVGRLNGITPETRRAEETVQTVWNQAVSLTTIVVGAPSLEAALQYNERVHRALVGLQSGGVISAFSSIAPLAPSEATRVRRRGDWRAFWTEARQQQFAAALDQASRELGFAPGAFRSVLDRLSAGPPATSTASAQDLPAFLDDYWSRAADGYFLQTLVKAPDRAAFEAVRQAVKGAVPTAMLLNKSALGEDIARVARRGLIGFGILVAMVNAVVLFFLLGRWQLVAITLLPILTGIFWTLGVLGLAGLTINVSNLIFVIFVIGVALDYSMFLLLARLAPLRGQPDRIASVGGSVTACALTTLVGIGSLALARHPALFSVGITAWIGITASLVATLFLIPFCLDRLTEQRERQRRRDQSARPGSLSFAQKLRGVRRRYRFQGPYPEQFAYWKLRMDPVFRRLDAVLPDRGDFLDLGCGYGMAAHWLWLDGPGRTVLGVDFDETKIRVAQASAQGLDRIRFELRDLLAWRYPVCDHVLLLDVLHYVPRDAKRVILNQAYVVMRPGGVVIAREAIESESRRHDRVARAERWAVRLGQNRTAQGLSFETREGYEELLRQAGFRTFEWQTGSGLGSNALVIVRK